MVRGNSARNKNPPLTSVYFLIISITFFIAFLEVSNDKTTLKIALIRSK